MSESNEGGSTKNGEREPELDHVWEAEPTEQGWGDQDGQEVSDSVNRQLRVPCRKKKIQKGGLWLPSLKKLRDCSLSRSHKAVLPPLVTGQKAVGLSGS